MDGMLSAGSNCQPHTGVSPVAKGLNKQKITLISTFWFKTTAISK